MPVYLASALIEAVRDNGMLPAADSRSATSVLLALMNREQRLYLMRLLQSAREEFQVTTYDVALVDGTTRYRLPGRAAASAITKVELVGDDSTAKPFPADQYSLQGHHLVLRTARASGSLRFTYPRRFNTIVTPEECGEVVDFDAGAGTVEISAVPDDFATTATDYDFVQGSPQFDILDVDQSATRSGTTLTFAEDLPDDLEVGDYVCLAGETPICNAPLELHDVLVWRAVAVHLLSRGDQKWKAAQELLEESRLNALSLIQPRVQDDKKALINPHGPGWNRWRGSRGGA